MNIIVHYPASPGDRAELSKRVAEIHAQAIIETLQEAQCTADEKIQLISAFVKASRERADS